jgi:two-component system, sensor histidine kinase and response regulator
MVASSKTQGNDDGSTPIFDNKIFDDLRNEGEEFFGELVDMFLASVPAQLDGLTQALDKGDGAGGARLAHTLKGTAATFGATEMQEQAAAISEAFNSHSNDKARGMLPQFRGECDRVSAALEKERSRTAAVQPATCKDTPDSE